MEESERTQLIEALAEYSNNPLGFVRWNYPWGEPGELERYAGPQDWQCAVLNDIGEGVISVQTAIQRAFLAGTEADTQPIQLATVSGHGIGKSALVAWILDWAQSTLEDTKGIVTANTENQLKTKTWAEFAKWHRLGLSGNLFKLTATARFSIDPDHEKTWRIDMVPWSEHNPEAFAGMHNHGKRLVIVFDEASNIADIIWETAQGALTDKNTEIIWPCFGNPTKNTGRFRECFPGGKFSHRWKTREINSLDVAITNKAELQKIVDDHGEDDDVTRVRVLGKFPRLDDTSFISLELARESVNRASPEINDAPVVLGVDVARLGSNKSVIYPRRGRDGRTFPPRVYSGLNTIQLATQVFNAYIELHAVAIFVDGGGVGGGVVDQLLSMGAPVYEVNFGAKSDGNSVLGQYTKYANKRAEIWGSLRDWLDTGCIPGEISGLDIPFIDELTAPSYSYVREEYIQLESKRTMRISPDAADALACTFAYPSAIPLPRQLNLVSQKVSQSYIDHNPFTILEKEYS